MEILVLIDVIFELLLETISVTLTTVTKAWENLRIDW